ncbi:TetR/AcrR family transcriptional regulator [Levilactobacillus zymae]|uniref:Transcriptional regulator, TetR family n=1 Tax=Levilactobacillus zymae TaxID=267363 RepID=A0A1Y6K0K0_9LACO|nr:TetR/AcrR family transcriptional regulator [Levilactobacillus zymae]SMS14921.1 Transcriptional regulator, TetR family [Levilactobacillus zymae]
MPRKRSFDKAAVLNQIMVYFWRNGFQETGLRELTDLTGVQAQSLYNAFGSKEALYVQAMEHYVTVAIAKADQILASDLAAEEQIGALLVLDWGKLPYPAGCMVISSGELDQVNPQLDAVANRLYDHLTICFQQVLTTLPDLRPGLPIDGLAVQLLTLHNGIQVAVQDDHYPANVQQLITTTLQTLKA